MTNESLATQWHMDHIFIGLRETILDLSECTPIKGHNPCKGLPRDPETKAKISAANKGREVPAEKRHQISLTLLEHPVSDDSKLKMSEAAQKRPLVSCICCRVVVQGSNNLNQHYRFKHP